MVQINGALFLSFVTPISAHDIWMHAHRSCAPGCAAEMKDLIKGKMGLKDGKRAEGARCVSIDPSIRTTNACSSHRGRQFSSQAFPHAGEQSDDAAGQRHDMQSKTQRPPMVSGQSLQSAADADWPKLRPTASTTTHTTATTFRWEAEAIDGLILAEDQ